MDAAERSLLLAQYKVAAKEALAVVEQNDGNVHVQQRALYILVQALCLDAKYEAALQALDTAYSSSDPIPARLLALWWLLCGDAHADALEVVLTYCSNHRTDDCGALLTLLVAQAPHKQHPQLAAWLQGALVGASSSPPPLDRSTCERLLEQLHASSHQAMPSTLSPSSTSASLSPSTSNHGDGHAEDAGEDYVKNAHTGGDVKNAHTGGGEIMPLADHRRHNMSKCQTTPPQPCTPQPPCDDSTCCTDVRDTNPSKRSVHNTSPIDQASSSSASPTYPTWEQHISTHTAHVQQAVSTAWHSAQEMLSTQQGATAAAKVGIGVLLGALLATAAYQERKPIARAVRRAASTLHHELTSTLHMAFGVIPNPIGHTTQHLRSRL